MKFNKSIKTQMVNAAITEKYRVRYEEQVRHLEMMVRHWLVGQSKHESITSKLDVDELKYCQAVSYVAFNRINVEELPFTTTSKVSGVGFEPVYGADIYRIVDDEHLELRRLRDLVSVIEKDLHELSNIVHTYKKINDLFEDLPWIKKHYPDDESIGNIIVPKDVIDSLNVKFGC